jgi:hypothetical protein
VGSAVVLSDLQPPRLRYFCPTSLCSSSSGVAIVSFQRLRKPNSAITPTISAIRSSVQCLRNSANISSVTVALRPRRWEKSGVTRGRVLTRGESSRETKNADDPDVVWEGEFPDEASIKRYEEIADKHPDFIAARQKMSTVTRKPAER